MNQRIVYKLERDIDYEGIYVVNIFNSQIHAEQAAYWLNIVDNDWGSVHWDVEPEVIISL